MSNESLFVISHCEAWCSDGSKYFGQSRSADRYSLCAGDGEHGFSGRGKGSLDARLFSRQELADALDLGLHAAAKAGDADSSDLFTQVSRGVDKLRWLVEAHAQSKD